MTWRKSHEAHKFFVESFWRKMSESAKREFNKEITASISRMSTPEKPLSKTLGKNYSFQTGNIFKFAQLNRKEIWTTWRCPWVSFLMTWNKLKTRLEIVTENKSRQTGLEEAIPKLIKNWPEQHEVISQSFYVSSGVAFSGNNDVWKILLFCD